MDIDRLTGLFVDHLTIGPSARLAAADVLPGRQTRLPWRRARHLQDQLDIRAGNWQDSGRGLMDPRSDGTAGAGRRDSPVRSAAGGPSLARRAPVRVGGPARRGPGRRLGRAAGVRVGGAALHRPGHRDRLVRSRSSGPAADAGRPAAVLRAAAGRRPNLASAVLARSLARLPGDYLEMHNQIVLAAETFTDPARHAGACTPRPGSPAPGRPRGMPAARAGAGMPSTGR